jgi:hypothetical protein
MDITRAVIASFRPRAIWDRGHDDVSIEITEAGREALAE